MFDRNELLPSVHFSWCQTVEMKESVSALAGDLFEHGLGWFLPKPIAVLAKIWRHFCSVLGGELTVQRHKKYSEKKCAISQLLSRKQNWYKYFNEIHILKKNKTKKTLLQDPGSVVGEAEDCRIVQMMFTYFGQKVCATLNPVAPAKGHPITPSLAARMCTKAVCWVGLMLQASCSFRSLGFWREKTPDHFCGFQQSLFKSWEKIFKKKKKYM